MALETENIKVKLHQIIDEMNGEKAESIYSLLKGELEICSFRKQLIRYEREKFLRGEGESFSWDEVKQMALNKLNRSAV